MANVCNQSLYIVASCDEDMRELLVKMLNNIEKRIKGSDEGGRRDPGTCEGAARKLHRLMGGFNPLCLLSQKPDTACEEAHKIEFGYVKSCPFVKISMGLKWGPSYDVQKYCNALDSSRYGFASINGGEYMCSQGDEIAYIQAGPNMADPFCGALDFDQFVDMRKNVREQGSSELSDLALLAMFNCESPFVYYWSACDSDPESDDCNSEDCNLVDLGLALSRILANPSVDDYEVIDEFLVRALRTFPLLRFFKYGELSDYGERSESLCPGDRLMLTADWLQGSSDSDTTNGACHISFSLYDLNGNIMGTFEDLYVFLDLEVPGLYRGGVNSFKDYAIACLLPHLVVTVVDITPSSLRSSKAVPALVTIRLDLEPLDYKRTLSEVHALLSRDLSDRLSTSKLPKGRE